MTDTQTTPTRPKQESERVEFKRDLGTSREVDRAARAICAFLNMGGGALYVGVGEGGSLVSLPNPEGTAERLQRALDERITPPYPAAVRVEYEDGKGYVVAEVPPGPEPPYALDEDFYVRRGTQVVTGSVDDLRELLNLRKERAQRWERRPALGLAVSDLDLEEVWQTVADAERGRLSPLRERAAPEAELEALHLMEGGQLTNAAAVLFAESPARRYPQTRVRAARFADDDATEFVDNQEYEGHAFRLTDALLEFLQRHVPMTSRLERGAFRREDRLAYPPFALREAIMNALVHRDYSAYSGGLSVAVYPNRLEVWNSGHLPEGLTVSALKTARVSRPHNPDIAHVFFLRGLIERWGIGTRRIVEECRASGLPDPRWEEVGGGIRLTLYLKRAESAVLEELNERMAAFLRESEPDDTLTSADYAERYAEGVSDRSARADLGRLVEMGFLDREGHGRTTRYRRTDAELPGEPR